MSLASKSINAKQLLSFLDSSPSPFHAIRTTKDLLKDHGFIQLDERSKWNLEKNGKYFFTRNGSSIVAFAIGGCFNPETSSAKIIAAHSDSPCLRLKPISKPSAKDGFIQASVETYGGGIWHSWFDRDLGCAGRLITVNQDGVVRETLIDIDRPILRVPTLAIHLDRSVKDGFSFNLETHLRPILSTESAMNRYLDGHSEGGCAQIPLPLAHGFSLPQDQEILAFDLCLYDVQKASFGGIYEEFIQSARLDNLFMSFCAIQSLTKSLKNIESEQNVRIAILYDNEEVGSNSAAGAESTLLPSCIERILNNLNVETRNQFIARSFLVSADMAHAAHPNYSDRHDDCHRPKMHEGIVIKYNSNQRYATSSKSAAFLKMIAKKAGIPYQEFIVRNDSPCGSTIGPIVSAQMGLQTVDVGAPQLSMHSIREMAGVGDVDNCINLFVEFYQEDGPNVVTLDASQ